MDIAAANKQNERSAGFAPNKYILVVPGKRAAGRWFPFQSPEVSLDDPDEYVGDGTDTTVSYFADDEVERRLNLLGAAELAALKNGLLFILSFFSLAFKNLLKYKYIVKLLIVNC